MKEKTIFNENLKNVNISPIFKNGDIIGYHYKNLENNNNDYSSYKKYYDLLLKGKLSNSIEIYFNYQIIYKKIIRKDRNPEIEKYYIINKGLLTEIKIYNDFKTIYDIIGKQKIDEEWKQKLLTFNSLSNEDLEKYIKKELNEYKYKENFEPNIIPLNYLNEPVFIYENFEIKKIIK